MSLREKRNVVSKSQKSQSKQSLRITELISNYSNQLIAIIAKLNKRGKLHGIDHFVSSAYHPIERFLWLILVILAFYGAFYVGNSQMERFRANPTVISIERDYRLWNGTMPALTFCYANRFDEQKAESLIRRFWNIDKSDEEYSYFLEYLRMVANASMFNFKLFSKYSNDKRFEFVDMITIAKDIHPNPAAVVSSFDPRYNPQIVEFMTERGVCFTINGLLSSKLQATKELSKLGESMNKPKTCSYKENQCFIRLEVSDPTIQFFIHSPFEIVTQQSLFIDIGPTDEIESTYDTVETIASPGLRSLTPEQRSCRFYDESISDFVGYNVNVCKLKCHAEAAIKMCRCRPHFYHFINGTSCSPSGLFCLSLNSWPGDVKCKCPKTCSELAYTLNTMKKTNWAANVDITTQGKISAIRYEILAQKIRFRRDILFSFEDLIVSLGGIASLFIGYNFFDTFGMIYYILELAIKYLHRNFYRK